MYDSRKRNKKAGTYFYNSCNIQGNLITPFSSLNWLDFSRIFTTFVDFAVQLCSWSIISTRSDAQVKSDSSIIFVEQSCFFAMQLATNEISSICMDGLLRKFSVYQKCANACFGDFEQKSFICSSLFLSYKTKIFHIAVHLFSNRSYRTSNVVRTSVTHNI